MSDRHLPMWDISVDGMHSPDVAIAEAMPYITALNIEQESFWVLPLDARHKVVGKPVLVSLGTVNTCHVHPRDVFREAIRRNCVSVLMLHNHPSGLLKFSKTDKALTERIAKAAKYLGMNVLDHIVFNSAGDYQSWYVEYGYIPFDSEEL